MTSEEVGEAYSKIDERYGGYTFRFLPDLRTSAMITSNSGSVQSNGTVK